MGERLRDARLRRRYTMDMVCVRANISRPTLTKIEQGDPAVTFGHFVQVLRVLGLDSDISLIAQNDPLGRNLQDEALPRRIRAPKTQERQKHMRLIAIGDIHGQHEKLENLLAQIRPTQQDQLVFLGDYIDRGPDSKGVIDCLIRLGKDFPKTVFLRGNHEQMVLDLLDQRRRERTGGIWGWQVWLMNGGKEALESYGVEKIDEIPQSHKDFLENTRLWYRQDGFFFVHAGYDENYPLEDQEDGDLLWTRYCPPGKKEIHVVGHTPVDDEEPFFEEGRYNLDTGATYGGKLTACDVLTRGIWQA